MPTGRIKPRATVSNSFSVFNAPSANVAMADGADGTYMECPSAFVGEATFLLGNIGMPAGAVVRQFAPQFRYEPQVQGYNTNPDIRIQIDGNWQGIQHPGQTAGRTWGATPPFVGGYSAATIDSLQVYVDGRIGISPPATSPTVTRWFEVLVDVLYALLPGPVRVTGPTGTLRVNNPTVTWQHIPGQDAETGQTYYRVRVYDVANPGVIVFDTGNVASAAQSAVVGPLTLQHSYRAVVNTMQTTSGQGQWSPDGETTFTLDVNGPTAVVTAPAAAAVVGTTSPTVTWTHTPGTGAQTGQTAYRIRAFDVNDLTTALYDTGEVASSAKSAVVGPLDPTISWRVTVNTAQTTYGALQWSPDASTTFTIDVVPALIASVTPEPDDLHGSIPLTILWDSTSPAWLTIDVEATYDDGATWVAVRGATHLSVNGTTAHVTDYEAPNDTPVRYRSRATRISAGVRVTGNWVESAVTSWHLVGDDVFIKDPDHPERNMRLCLSQLPQPFFDRAVGVFRPLGASFPVVVSDVLQAPTFTVSIVTSTGPEADALLLLVQSPVVLFQSPPLAWGWRSIYVALGAVQQSRTRPTSVTATRLWDVAMTVVARPADETAT